MVLPSSRVKDVELATVDQCVNCEFDEVVADRSYRIIWKGGEYFEDSVEPDQEDGLVRHVGDKVQIQR